MRKIYLLGIAAILSLPVVAQELRVGAGAQLTILSGTDLSINGLALSPSARLNLGDQLIEKETTVLHPLSTYIARTYRFSTPLVFTGSIQINYLDAELNGLNESSLRLGVYNGSVWQSAGISTPVPASNYVFTSGLSNQSISELTLTTSVALPLQWGNISAVRQGEYVLVTWNTEQEFNVSHFDVERSVDGLNWTVAIAHVASWGRSSGFGYAQTDRPHYPGRIYYRIRQTDTDRRYTFSRVVTVAAEGETPFITVGPNPASSYFNLTGMDPAAIAKVELLNTGGSLVQTWKGNQTRFVLGKLAPGIYYLRVQMTGGEVVSKQLVVK